MKYTDLTMDLLPGNNGQKSTGHYEHLATKSVYESGRMGRGDVGLVTTLFLLTWISRLTF